MTKMSKRLLQCLRWIGLFSFLCLSAAADPVAGVGSAGTHHILCPPAGYQSKLLIHQLNVGQGDAALIRSPSGTTVLIDGGVPGSGNSVILPTLKQCYSGVISTIDYIVNTHPHIDHYGGLSEVIKAFPVGTVIVSTTVMEKGERGIDFQKFLAIARTRASRVVVPSGVGTNLIVDRSPSVADFHVVVANGVVDTLPQTTTVSSAFASGFNVDDNSVSIGMTITYKGKFKFFTAGDLTGGKSATGENHPDVESAVARIVSKVDVYKASHHGSDTANKPPILNALQPSVVLVSVGAGGDNLRPDGTGFRLPRMQAMEAMQSLPSVQDIYMTSQGASADISPTQLAGMSKVNNTGGVDGTDLMVLADESAETFSVYSTDSSGQVTHVKKYVTSPK